MTATTVSSAVARREAGPINVMWDRKTHFAAVLPDHLDVKGFLGTAAGTLYSDDDLMKAAERNPDSLIVTLMRCASLGHRPGTDEFYLHIRKGKVSGTEGYRGVIERMYRSGAVKNVIVREVCAKDQFRYVEGVDDKPAHSFGGQGATGADFFGAEGFRDRGPMVGVYAYAVLMTGAVSRVVVLNRADVMAARESSDARDSSYSPWNRLDAGKDHPEFTGRSMWWKTAAKRLEPWVPTSAEYRREQLRAASAASDLSAARIAAGNGSAQPVMPPPPDLEIHDAEIVAEPQPERPARAQKPTGAMIGKLGKLLGRILADAPAADVAAFLAWQSGRNDATTLEALTRDEAGHVIAVLEAAGQEAGGDTEQAASALWARYRAERQDADAETGDEDSDE